MSPCDVAVVGAGAVGLATARALARGGRMRVRVVEAEPRLAAHQTGHNSGVIHSGLYYRPGSHKASNCVAGRTALLRFCEQRGIPHEVCGKVVVAATAAEIPRLDELERRGRANGLADLRRLDPGELRRLEPHAAGCAALHVPQTGIVDFVNVAAALAGEIADSGGEVLTSARLRRVERRGAAFVLHTTAGEFAASRLVACAGLQSDRVARMCGLRPRIRIVPFRGEYWTLRPERAGLVRNLIYPVPDPRFPFLGVHFTRRVDGTVEAGPNALLALAREGYGRGTVSARDLFDMLSFVGLWRLVARYGRTGLGELRRSISTRALARALGALVPEVRPEDLRRAGAGVRAQAVGRDGSLVDDFHVLEEEGMLHVLNAPSPAATACLAIGETLAERSGSGS